MSEPVRPAYLRQVPDGARFLHESRYAVRWSDMDAFGHVNNATYFTYFEQVRIDWLAALGEAHALVLACVGCTFVEAVRHPATLRVRLYAGRPGRSSLDTYYEILDADDGRTYALGHGTLVWYDHAARRSVPIPERVRALLS